MWYFTWILGVLLACAFAILNGLWHEMRSLDDRAARDRAASDRGASDHGAGDRGASDRGASDREQ
jgi:cyd operon protein YbgT